MEYKFTYLREKDLFFMHLASSIIETSFFFPYVILNIITQCCNVYVWTHKFMVMLIYSRYKLSNETKYKIVTLMAMERTQTVSQGGNRNGGGNTRIGTV